MAAILSTPEVASQAPASPLENALQDVTPADASATTSAEATFQFRSLLDDAQRAALQASAPAKADEMLKDYNSIISFGEEILRKMNAASVALLEEQKGIQLPEADELVNNLLREIDGYNAKYRNQKLEDFASKVRKFFKGTTYSLKAMVRDAKPLVERLNIVEVKISQMEGSLRDNATRARRLHTQTLSTLNEVIVVLAALEEIADVIRKRYTELDEVVRTAEAANQSSATYKGQEYTLNELNEMHADIAAGLSEVEKSWFDWRQQFFLGYAFAPSLRNLILISASMQRRLHVFRTQGIPSARTGIAMWQQSALAKEGSEMGDALAAGTNKLVSEGFAHMGETVRTVAMSAQAPLITDQTIFAIVDSVKAQAQGLVDADKWGREQRARNLQALESGERSIDQAGADARRQMVAQALASSNVSNLTTGAPVTQQGDILAQLGVAKS
jgi:uncharacterized protein YaaN involved in tellurite resistance